MLTKKQEEGLRELRIYSQSSWNGYKKIGRFIVHRYGLPEKYLEFVKKEKVYVKRYRRPKKLKEEGLLVYSEFLSGPWHGFLEVRKYIKQRYGLVKEDFKIFERLRKKYYARNYRKKLKKKNS